MAIQLVSLLEKNFALFSGNFLSNFSSEFLLVAGSEKLDGKASLSEKTSGKVFAWGMHNGYSKTFKMSKENIETLLQ